MTSFHPSVCLDSTLMYHIFFMHSDTVRLPGWFSNPAKWIPPSSTWHRRLLSCMMALIPSVIHQVWADLGSKGTLVWMNIHDMSRAMSRTLTPQTFPRPDSGEWQASLMDADLVGRKHFLWDDWSPRLLPCRDLLLRLAKLFIQLHMLLGYWFASHSPPHPFSHKTVSVVHCHPSKVSSKALEGRHYSSSVLSLLKNSCYLSWISVHYIIISCFASLTIYIFSLSFG